MAAMQPLRVVRRVPEVRPWFHRCLSKVLLAQAQALFAHNAVLKASAPALTVSLFIGASDLFEEAAQMIAAADNTDEPLPCDDFKCGPLLPLPPPPRNHCALPSQPRWSKSSVFWSPLFDSAADLNCLALHMLL